MSASDIGLLSDIQRSAVKEIANIGLGHAAKSLSDMTGQTFHLTVPNIDSLPVEHVSRLMGGPETLTVGVFMPFEGDVSGHLAFVFPWTSATGIWNLLMGESPSGPEDVNEIHASAMIEIGNILNSHFLNAIADMTSLAMHSTVPSVGIDAAHPIIQSILVEAELMDAVALTVETAICNEEVGITGYFLFIPAQNGLETILQKLGVSEAA